MEQTRSDVRGVFNQTAVVYDNQRRKLIPCFDDFYGTAVLLAGNMDLGSEPRILDLGAGTGLLSAMLLEQFPNARLTLIDLSENMLDVARSRFKDYPYVEYLVADYTKQDFTEKPYDLIVSALSIHHLEHGEKRSLYQAAYRNLRAGGVFINADQVLGATSYLDGLYKDDWKQKIEATSLTKEELAAAYERTKLDRMSPLQEQLDWLGEVGFSDVDCVYKSFNFVVLYGRKLM